MKKRYYIDTSVFGGYFDQEFSDTTKELFSEILKEDTIILYSEMTENELSEAPESITSLRDYLQIRLNSLRLAWKQLILLISI